MESENPVWLGEYVWEETPLDGGPLKSGPLPDEVLSMFRPQHCLLCGITTANMQTAYMHYESKGHFKKVTHHMREKFNALGSLKSIKEKFRPVTCDICNVELTNRIVYLQHYNGKQHMKNKKKRGLLTSAEELALGSSGPSPGNSAPEAASPKDQPVALPKLGDYVCALCNVTTATKVQMQVHNNGSRHLKNVAKLADGELRDFYVKNGNCEPVENNDSEIGPREASGQASQPPNQMTLPDQVPGGFNGNYGPQGPPMDPSMMNQQYPPQMPYGQYPQYPMPYDYNTWGQPNNMYPGYNSGPPPFNGQYGPGPYGQGPQQYPPYGYPQGPPSDFYNSGQQQPFNPGQQQQFNPGPQQFNPGPQQFNPAQQQFNPGQHQFNPGQQQFNPGQQQFNPGQQQFNPGQQQFNPGPQQFNPEQQQFNPGQQHFNPGQQQFNPGPQQFNSGQQQFNSAPQQFNNSGQQQFNHGQQPYNFDYFNNTNSYQPTQSDSPGNDPRTINPSDPRRRRVREPAKEPEVNETPIPEGVAVKSFAILPFLKQISKDAGDDHPPGVDGPPGIDKSESCKCTDEGSPTIDDGTSSVKGNKTDKASGEVESGIGPSKDGVSGNGKSESTKEGLLVDNSFNAKSPSPALPDKEDEPEVGGSIESSSDLPPIPGLDVTPGVVDGKPPIITWTDPNKVGDETSDSNESPALKSSGLLPGEVEPPPPHPLNPPIHFLPPSPESLAANPPQPIRKPSPMPHKLPISCDSQPSQSDVALENTESQAPPQSSLSQAPAPSFSQPPVATIQQPFQPSHPQLPYPQISAAPQPVYPQVPNYHVPYPHSSNHPVTYSQSFPASYPSLYLENSSSSLQSHSRNSSALPQMPLLKPTNPPPPIPHAPPPQPPVPVEPEKPSDLPSLDNTPSSSELSNEDKTSNSLKEGDPSKSATSKPKINSFFRRAAEKMFKEAKEKKLKEEAKKLEIGAPEEFMPHSSVKDASKDAIIIIPPSSGPKPEENVVDSANANSSLKARIDHESISGTDNDVGSEPGEIIDKKPVDVVGKSAVAAPSTETVTAKQEKSKFDFGSKKSSENRRKRSFRVRKSSASRSRSRSRTPKRRSRRRSHSWSPSPERSPIGYYQRNDSFRSYYGNDSGYWRNDRVQYRTYEEWDEGHNDRFRRRPERDEFGRERKWKEEKRRVERKKKKRKSSKRESRSSSRSPEARKSSKGEKGRPEKKSPPRKSSPPVAKTEKCGKYLEETIQKPLAASLMQRLKGSSSLPDRPEVFQKDAPAILVEEVANTVEVRDIVIRPDVDSDEAREVEKEEQEILKKVALIKKKLMEKDEEKLEKKKKHKKEKLKRKRKKKKRSSSSSSESSTSSESSSSSSSTTSSSSSSSSSNSEPKSKRIVESLLSKLSQQAAAGEVTPFDLSMLPDLVKKSKKGDGGQKKKKEKKKKKKKLKKKEPALPPQILSTFIAPDGAYHCKCCNLSTSSGSTFIEHLISEKHKLMLKIVSTAK